MRKITIPVRIFLILIAVASCSVKKDQALDKIYQDYNQPIPNEVTFSVTNSDLMGYYRASYLSGDYANYPELERFIEHLVETHGFKKDYLYGLFSEAKRKSWTLNYLRKSDRAPKKTGVYHGSWSRYRAKFLDKRHIRSGASFWLQHEDDLRRASEQYGVPAEYILGIMAIETTFGQYVGNHRVLDALTTLAFDYPRRADFFRSELEHFLIMASHENIDPATPVGSYAGAMGLGQFMPSSFMKWAVDFDEDGRKDLWNPVDAIGSIANYFAEHGWLPGEPVVTSAKMVRGTPQSLETGFSKRYSLDYLAQYGINADENCACNYPLHLLQLSNYRSDEYWLGHPNFYVITRYNHSTHYAMAVHELAQAIKGAIGR